MGDVDVFGDDDGSAEDVEVTVAGDPPEHIALEAPEDDEDSEEEAPRPSRKERRSNRFKELREQVETLRRQLDERPAPQIVYAQPPPQPRENSGVDPELQSVYDKQKTLNAEYQRLSADEQNKRYDEFYNKAQAIEVEKLSIVGRRAAAEMADVSEKRAMRNMVQANNADIFNYRNKRGQPVGETYFESVWKRMVLAEERPDTTETMEAALEETRRALRLASKKPAPSDSLKARLTGAPRGGASREAPKSFPMTKEYKKLARAAYPGLSEQKAYEKWVRTTGKSLLSDKDDD